MICYPKNYFQTRYHRRSAPWLRRITYAAQVECTQTMAMWMDGLETGEPIPVADGEYHVYPRDTVTRYACRRASIARMRKART